MTTPPQPTMFGREDRFVFFSAEKDFLNLFHDNSTHLKLFLGGKPDGGDLDCRAISSCSDKHLIRTGKRKKTEELKSRRELSVKVMEHGIKAKTWASNTKVHS